MPLVSEEEACRTAGYSPQACEEHAIERARISTESVRLCNELVHDNQRECAAYCGARDGSNVLTCVHDFIDAQRASEQSAQLRTNLMISAAIALAIVAALAYSALRAAKKR